MKYYSLLLLLLIATLVTSCKKDPIPGCTNPKAENYDPKATEDTGNCVIKGCTNPKAENFNPEATADDGFCIIRGCTNPQAENYDPEANVDNGTCIIKGCTDPKALNYNQAANTDDGSCVYENAKFVGTYKGPIICTNTLLNTFLMGQEVTFVFEEIPGTTTKVSMRLQSTILGDQTVEGSINGNQVSYTSPQQTIMIDIDGNGTPDNITVSNSGVFTTLYPEPKMDGVITLKITLPFNGIPVNIEDSCTIKATKQ